MGKEHTPYKLAELYPKKPKPDSRYYIQFSAINKNTGELVERRFYVPSELKTHKEKAEWAKEEIAKINLLLLEGVKVGDRQPPASVVYPLIVDTFPKLLEERKNTLRRKSYQSLQSIYRKFEAYLLQSKNKSLTIKDFSTKHLESYIDYLLKLGNAATTINNNTEKIGWFFEQAISKGFIENKNYKRRKLPETETVKNVAFTREHQKIVENWMFENDFELYLFTRFMYHAFIRPKELRALTVTNVDLYARVITIQGTISKNRKNESVPINLTLFGLLSFLDGKMGFLFGKNLVVGSRLKCQENEPYNRHAAALLACGLNGLGYSLYSWKHTGAVRAYQSGVDIKKLQRLLRHSSLTITDIYLRSLNVITDIENLAGW
ncbi:MAG: tyrosine-type recombinase/integrase [Runella zeae]